MLGIGGGEETRIIPSSNEWPQQTTVGDWLVTGNSATASTAGCAAARNLASEMGRPRPDEQQQLLQQAGPLRCPRCDSSNTKFCYYNNYSLAQPRHFCKACKRYWTRGGTLRNVPVGGGCRKNKRARKPSPSDPPPAATVAPPPLPRPPPSRPTELNPFLYADISSLAFPSIRAVQEGNISNPCAAYDLQNQLSALGVGFAPEEYQPRFGTDQSHLQHSAMMSSAASLSHDYSLFDSSLSPATAASLLLVSSLNPPTKTDGYQDSLPYEHLQPAENGNPGVPREAKVEAAEANADGCNRIDWPLHCENPFQALAAAAAADSRDSQFLYWNAMACASWPDESNLESSVASLI